MPLNLFARAIPAWFLFIFGGECLPTPAAAPADPGILFLRLRRDDDGSGFRLVEAVRTPGRIKEPRAELPHGFRFELQDANGGVMESGVVDDVSEMSLEHVDLSRPGMLVRRPVRDVQREFTVRVPCQRGASRVILRRQSGRVEGARVSGDEFVGDFSLDSMEQETPRRVAPTTLNQPVFKQIVNNGSNSNRINIVVLSEGYRDSELTRFEEDAKKATDYLLNTAPWNGYQNYCNVFLIEVASVESGSDHPSTQTFKDTYFNSTFESFGIDRLLTIPPNDLNDNYSSGVGKVMTLLRRYLPDYDLALMIVNDNTYGGSGGSPAIASTDSSAAEILVHEVGHSFAGLGDEYDSPFPGFPDIEEPNTTRETRPSFIKWKSWILDSTPIPTDETKEFKDVVGLFEGAHFHRVGWYRPKLSCRMNSLGTPFCEVCAEAHILRIYRLIEPIDGLAPQAGLISLLGGGSSTFETSLLKPSTHSLQVAWILDGKPISSGVPTRLTLRAEDVGNGEHRVRMVVSDNTSLVRDDPKGLLRRTRDWTLRVTGVVAPLRLGTVSRAVTGRIEFDLTGEDVFGVSVEASEDLEVWTLIFTSAVRGVAVRVVDSQGSGNARRYYRAVKR